MCVTLSGQMLQKASSVAGACPLRTVRGPVQGRLRTISYVGAASSIAQPIKCSIARAKAFCVPCRATPVMEYTDFLLCPGAPVPSISTGGGG